MAQLLATRTGWQSEHLGLFILSKFAFCANPVTVSDDLGSDFFCCLFETRGVKGEEELAPQNSFAIQIKSSRDLVDVSKKVQYLADLELPYLLGVVDKRRMRLSLYSGEYLPLLFSQFALPTHLRIKPVNRRQVGVGQYCERYGERRYRVLFPLVAHVPANASATALRQTVRQLRDLCRRIQGNIATRRTNEHIYSLQAAGQYYILAGSSSAKVFRDNFFKRLAEALYNFEWLLKNEPSQFKAEEAQLYRDFLTQMKERGISVPRYLRKVDLMLARSMRAVAV